MNDIEPRDTSNPEAGMLQPAVHESDDRKPNASPDPVKELLREFRQLRLLDKIAEAGERDRLEVERTELIIERQKSSSPNQKN